MVDYVPEVDVVLKDIFLGKRDIELKPSVSETIQRLYLYW